MMEIRSKYQEKLMKRFKEEHPDSWDIALKLYEAERDPGKITELRQGNRLNIRTDDTMDGPEKIWADAVSDCLAWYIWKDVPYKADRCYFKIVPRMHLDYKTIANILDAQPWIYL